VSPGVLARARSYTPIAQKSTPVTTGIFALKTTGNEGHKGEDRPEPLPDAHLQEHIAVTEF
jgi:hypothetical protein